MISGSISLPSPGFFSTFPHGTDFTIGLDVVFSLGPWSAQIPTGFPVSRGTWDTSRVPLNFIYEALTLLGVTFQLLLLSIRNPTLRSHNPLDYFVRNCQGFRLFPFRSPLLGESR